MLKWVWKKKRRKWKKDKISWYLSIVQTVIQYGYLTLFASSVPIAPLLALLNNVVGTYPLVLRPTLLSSLSALPSPFSPLPSPLSLSSSPRLMSLSEMRTDTFKWLTSYNKPFYKGADDIGKYPTSLSLLPSWTSYIVFIYLFLSDRWLVYHLASARSSGGHHQQSHPHLLVPNSLRRPEG